MPPPLFLSSSSSNARRFRTLTLVGGRRGDHNHFLLGFRQFRVCVGHQGVVICNRVRIHMSTSCTHFGEGAGMGFARANTHTQAHKHTSTQAHKHTQTPHTTDGRKDRAISEGNKQRGRQRYMLAYIHTKRNSDQHTENQIIIQSKNARNSTGL